MTSLPFRRILAGMSGVLLLAWAAPVGAQTTQETSDNPTAYDALHTMAKSLGKESLDRVVEIAGRAGAPQPGLWKIVLKEGTGSREVDVEAGKITAQRPLTRPPAYPAVIRLSDLNLDSSGAFDATNAQARKVKLRFDSLNYVLRVNESTDKPVWHIELINTEGAGVGAIRVAAHDGTVIATDGRLAANLPPAISTPRPTPRPVVVSTPPPPHWETSTPYPVSTPRPVTTTTTTVTTVERPPRVVGSGDPVMTDSDNVYAPTSPPEEQGGLFTRTGRTLDHTQHRVENTLRRTGEKIQRFFTFQHDSDQQDARPESQAPSNRPD